MASVLALDVPVFAGIQWPRARQGLVIAHEQSYVYLRLGIEQI